MAQISLQIPQSGQLFSTEGPKVASDMTVLQNVINGNLDTTNITSALAQSATVNTGGVIVKGAVSVAASESRTNVAYGTLTTPDQVTSITLPSNGLIAVWYQATWQESVSGAGRAAIFLGANQVVVAATGATPQTTAAAMSVGATANINRPLFSMSSGLASADTGATVYTGDVSTGQIVGVGTTSLTKYTYELNGSTANASNNGLVGGACYIFAAAGTYTVGVQFKASSGNVTASNRKLWVQALSFV